MSYRPDIDGLRTLAVVSVIFFHLGFIPNGYLGVDVFFVISGYLITSIVYAECKQDKFSVLKFYERRLRRIMPLLLFVSLVALVLGLILMLPDDLENLCQSIVATNFSVNNILMYITSADYWAVKNEYKPLMHTWSLGIEEQFYLLYPFVFYLFRGNRHKYIIYVLLCITILSLTLFLAIKNPSQKFYFIQYRFFELSVGGLAAILVANKYFQFRAGGFFLTVISLCLVALLFSPFAIGNDLLVVLTTLLSVTLIFFTSGPVNKNFYNALFESRLMVWLGKISFSLYMWHQLILAFSRYTLIEEITPALALLLISITLGLSWATYLFIETPFRNAEMLPVRRVLAIVALFFIVSTTVSLYVYAIGGVIRDFPELGLYKENNGIETHNYFSSERNIHIQYNEAIRELDRDFESNRTLKVLVIGNSFGRDVVNIILESKFSNAIQVRYFDINRVWKDSGVKERIRQADKIIIVAKDFIGRDFISKLELDYDLELDDNRYVVFGTKDFGFNNGIYYTKVRLGADYQSCTTHLKEGVYEINLKLREEWGENYIDLLAHIMDKEGKVPVFTSDGKFISQDTLHLTQYGAIFLADILEAELIKITKV
jgi:peptidoglycan/LPS O-acetylase OafA/YrhL